MRLPLGQEKEVRLVEKPVSEIVALLEGHGGKATSAENNDRFRVLSHKVNELENRAKARRRALLTVRAHSSVDSITRWKKIVKSRFVPFRPLCSGDVIRRHVRAFSPEAICFAAVEKGL